MGYSWRRRTTGSSCRSSGAFARPSTELVPLLDCLPDCTFRANLAPIHGNQLFFTIETPSLGRELWASDGTREGTGAVADACPGPCNSEFAPYSVGDTLFFFGSLQESSGSANPAPEEQTRVYRLARGSLEPVASLAALDGVRVVQALGSDKLLFLADDGVSGSEFWALELPGAGPCKPSNRTLCLGGGRFEVTVDWQDFQSGSGAGRSVPLTDDTGAFWFFDDENLELVVKVLDGTALNDHHWVFYGALSNVAYTLRVRDTETGAIATYDNELGAFGSNGDTTALPSTMGRPQQRRPPAMAESASTSSANLHHHAEHSLPQRPVLALGTLDRLPGRDR